MGRIIKSIFYGVLLLSLVIQSCSKKKEVGVNPYDGAKEALGIVFTKSKASPEAGLPGETISLSVKGLLKYEKEFKILLNQVECPIINLSDSNIDIQIPSEVSSGIVVVELNNQIFYGPHVAVEGKASVDTDFKIVNGFNNTVTDILSNSGGFIVTGAFTNFENQVTASLFIRGIHYLNSLGNSSSGMSFGTSAIGGITSITKLSNGKFIVGGNLTSFNAHAVGAITRLNINGSLDTTVVSIINSNPESLPLGGKDTVPSFNGYLGGNIQKVFATADNGVIAVGSFTSHNKIDFSYSSKQNRRRITSKVSHLAKLKENGSLDSSFNINNIGFNGVINDAIALSDGRIVVVGSFTTYNGNPANHIICIKTDGTIDESFSKIGADKNLLSITYNSSVKKIAVAGEFSTFNGKPVSGVIVLNEDGTIDDTFQFGELDGGSPSFAYKLNNGRIFVKGTFKKYNGIRRGGILILESNGVAKQEYNNIGEVSGTINTIVETTSSLSNPAILLGGTISTVDGKTVGNIFKIELKN